jgi:hypothetical protein
MAKAATDISVAIDEFVDDLTTLIKTTTAELVEQALSGVRIPPARARAGRSTRGVKINASLSGVGLRRKGAKRTAEELEELTSSLLGYIAKNPGQRIEQIGKALSISTKELVLPARKLLAESKIVTEGQKRSTTYFAS